MAQQRRVPHQDEEFATHGGEDHAALAVARAIAEAPPASADVASVHDVEHLANTGRAARKQQPLSWSAFLLCLPLACLGKSITF